MPTLRAPEGFSKWSCQAWPGANCTEVLPEMPSISVAFSVQKPFYNRDISLNFVVSTNHTETSLQFRAIMIRYLCISQYFQRYLKLSEHSGSSLLNSHPRQSKSDCKIVRFGRFSRGGGTQSIVCQRGRAHWCMRRKGWLWSMRFNPESSLKFKIERYRI